MTEAGSSGKMISPVLLKWGLVYPPAENLTPGAQNLIILVDQDTGKALAK